MRAKLARFAVVTVVVSLSFAPWSAHAANPARGTLSPSQTSLKWKGGPFLAPRPIGCMGPGDTTCDYFFLKLNLAPGSEIQIKMTTPRSTSGLAPIDGDDFDIYVWGPNDEIIAEGATDSGNESLTFTHTQKLRNYVYEIEIVPFIVNPGSGYTARATVVG